MKTKEDTTTEAAGTPAISPDTATVRVEITKEGNGIEIGGYQHAAGKLMSITPAQRDALLAMSPVPIVLRGAA